MLPRPGQASVLMAGALGASTVLGGCTAANSANVLARIQHIVVVYDENHSFDNLYGRWEGVNGLGSANVAHTLQVAQSGMPYTCLGQNDVNLTSPFPLSAQCTDATTQPLLRSHFKNAPFNIDDYIPVSALTCPRASEPYQPREGVLNGNGEPGGCTRDLVHRFYQGRYQLNGGKQNRFVTGSDAIGLTMGVYHTQRLPIYVYLHQADHPNYAILDNFFQAAFGGSFLNHQWLIAATTPEYPAAPGDLHSIVDSAGMPISYPLYTADREGVEDRPLAVVCSPPPPVADLACGDRAINTMQPAFQPTDRSKDASKDMLPALTNVTIGDRLSGKGIDWAWYSGGWSNAAGDIDAPGWTNGSGPTCSDPSSFPNDKFPYCPDKVFQFHHQPFNYFARYGLETRGRVHLRDEKEFMDLVKSSRDDCKLKAVSFVKPIGRENEHPGYASESAGSDHLVELVQAIEGSRCKADTMVILTYDEFGGQWDHVPPPGWGGIPGPHDIWGPGPRVPALVVSPFLKGRFVIDHTQYDTTSILATIEHRYGLMPLGPRDAAVHDLLAVFQAEAAAGLGQPLAGPITNMTVSPLVFGSLALAVAFMLARCLIAKRPKVRIRRRLKMRMGSPGWDFTKSWASNFTVVGAVLGTIVGATGVIPEVTQFFPKGSYAALNVFFGVLVVLAPFVYLATQHPKRSHTRHGDMVDQPQGYVWSFLLATLITLWAVLGELGTIAFLVYEIRSAGSLPSSVTYVFAGAMAVAGLLVLWYLWTAIPATIRDQGNRRHHLVEIRAQMRFVGVLHIPPASDIVPPLPSWSVF